MSEGNGHPYSWSAIFNGYNAAAMADCPFPVIPEYLSKQNFPEDGLGHLAQVTHVWTQKKAVSEHIARASKIENVVDRLEDMATEVDAVLLARDDAEKHYEMARPFIEKGLPIYIDKPLALSVEEVKQFLEIEQYENQIFSCSPLRFATELSLTSEEKERIGEVVHIEASTPKAWDTYAIHLIDPVLKELSHRGRLKKVTGAGNSEIRSSLVEWEEVTGFFKTTGKIATPFKIQYFGENGDVEKRSVDAFHCFKRTLEKFIRIIRKEEDNISRKETLEAIRIIEETRK